MDMDMEIDHTFCDSRSSDYFSGISSNQSDEEFNLEIQIQPVKEFRYRYRSELTKGKHGELKGSNGGFVTIKLNGPNIDHENTIISCNLCLSDIPQNPSTTMNLHPNLLINLKDNNEENYTNPIEVKLDSNNLAVFNKITIVMTRRLVVGETLKKKMIKAEKYNKMFPNISNFADTAMKTVRLRFDAFHVISNEFKPICNPIYSDIINHEVRNTTLKIQHFVNSSGLATGNENMIILCEPFKKDSISVRFFETNMETNEETWSADAVIIKDHFQNSLLIHTPKYENENIEEPVEVLFELRIKSNDNLLQSAPETFLFRPTYETLQRKNLNALNSFINNIEEQVPSIERSILSTEQGLLTLCPINSLVTDGPNKRLKSERKKQLKEHPNSITRAQKLSFVELSNELKVKDILHKYVMENNSEKIMKILGIIRIFNLQKFLALQNDDGNTCLHIACLYDRVRYFDQLLDLAEKVNIRNYEGNTALHIAVMKENIPCVEKLIKVNQININLINYDGNTPLSIAVCLKNLNIIKILIEIGDAVLHTKNGCSILQLAVMQNDKHTVEYFCKNFLANTDDDNLSGLTALDLAKSLKFQEIVDILEKVYIN